MDRLGEFGRRWVVAFAVAAVVGGAAVARADRIVLRGGGKIPGKMLPDPGAPDRVLILMERGRSPLKLSRAQVLEVIPEASPLDEYLVKRDAVEETAAAQFALGLWCEEHALRDLATIHFEAAVARDETFGPAHEKLGHQEINGVWLSGDALREAQGLVKFKGRWVTPEERDQKQQQGAATAEHAAWVRRVRAWREAMVSGTEDRRREAESQLMAIEDPAAVEPLIRVFGRDDDPLRILLARVVGGIPGKESARGLVRLLLGESVASVRGTIVNELTRRGDPEATTALIAALKSRDTAVVNRAAWGLSHLNAVNAVPSLVSALITSFTRMEMPSMSMPSGGPSGVMDPSGLPSATFGATYGGGAVPMAYNGSSVGYLTGPVVGPGVVAFGATSAPVVPLPPDPLTGLGTPAAFFNGPTMSGLNLGANGMGGGRGPVPRPVSYAFRNTEVLAALVKLTSQDFGYDLNAWSNWLRTGFRPEPEPARRVPQP